MNNPLVSIIIPTFNRACLIGETLDSVLAQTYENWECIIIDDGSTDNSQDVIRDYVIKDARFRFFNRDVKKVKGASSCRNTGLILSKGDYVIFLDSDDWLLEFCLSQRVNIILSKPTIDFVVLAMKTKKHGHLPINNEIPYSEDYIKDFLSYKLHWQTMCTFWKKTFLIEISGFNEKYPRLNDPELHIRGMLESKDNFYIGREFPADCIYRIDDIKIGKVFSEKYLNSLHFFLIDMVYVLEKNNRVSDKIYLKNYLLDYFLNFSFNLSFKQSYNLILISKKATVINSTELVCLIIWTFLKRYNFKFSNYINSKLNIYIKKIL